MPSDLCNNLRKYHTAANLTQAALANKVCVSRKTINTIENKVFVPSTVLALTLAKVLNVSVHEIFELET